MATDIAQWTFRACVRSSVVIGVLLGFLGGSVFTTERRHKDENDRP